MRLTIVMSMVYMSHLAVRQRWDKVGQEGQMRNADFGMWNGRMLLNRVKGMLLSVDPEGCVVKKILPAKTQSGKGKVVKTPLFPRGAL
jgi:hypothetical protein